MFWALYKPVKRDCLTFPMFNNCRYLTIRQVLLLFLMFDYEMTNEEIFIVTIMGGQGELSICRSPRKGTE